jgi:O-methyltransferase domain
MPFFAYLDPDPELAEVFNNAVTAARGLTNEIALSHYDFMGFTLIADVGGGHRALLSTIVHRAPPGPRTCSPGPASGGPPPPPQRQRLCCGSPDSGHGGHWAALGCSAMAMSRIRRWMLLAAACGTAVVLAPAVATPAVPDIHPGTAVAEDGCSDSETTDSYSMQCVPNMVPDFSDLLTEDEVAEPGFNAGAPHSGGGGGHR